MTFNEYRNELRELENEYEEKFVTISNFGRANIVSKHQRKLVGKYLEFYLYLIETIPHRQFGAHEKKLLIKLREGFSQIFGENWLHDPRASRKIVKELNLR